MRSLVLRLFVCVLFFQVAVASRADFYPIPGAGTIRFEYDLYPVYQSDTSVTLKVLRENGTDGYVNVQYITESGSAQSGIDYQDKWGVVGWANGDSTPKYITIPLNNTSLTQDRSFYVKIYTPTYGADLGSKFKAEIKISSTNHSRLPSYILKRQFPTVGFINGLLIEGAYHGVSGVGDIDGDGQEDIAAGAYVDRVLESCAEGALYVLSHIAKSNQASINVASDSGTSKVSGTDFFSMFGDLVSGVGDVNGDGYNDIVVGASKEVFPNETDGGHFYIIYGSINGIDSQTTISTLVSSGKATRLKYTENTYLDGGVPTLLRATPLSVSGIGDYNGDGYSDFIITQLEEYYTITYGLRTKQTSYIIYGGGTIVPIILLDEILPSQGYLMDLGKGPHLSGAGDFNGDGFSDLVVGYWEATYISYGGTGFPNPLDNLEMFSMQVHYQGIGDVNGDGYDDIGVALSWSEDSTIYIMFGSSEHYSFELPWEYGLEHRLSVTWPGRVNEIHGIGDINGDGFADIGIRGDTKTFYSEFQTMDFKSKSLSIIYGSPHGVGTTVQPVDEHINLTNYIDGQNALIIEDDFDTDRYKFSNSFRHAGDVNQDGFSDLLIGYGIPTGDAFAHCLVDPGNSYVIHGKGPSQLSKYTSFLKSGNSLNRGIGMLHDGSHSTPFSRVWINHTGGSVSKEEVTLYRNKSSFTNCPADTLNVGWKIKSNRTGQSSTKVRFRYLDNEILSTENALAVLTAPTPSGPWVRAEKISHNLIKNEITIEMSSLPTGDQYYVLAPLGSVYEKASLVVMDQGISIPAVNVNSYNFANCSLSSDSLQTISSHVHVKQSQLSGASGTIKSSRNLWNLGNDLCPMVSSVCGDSQYTTYPLTVLGSYNFNLTGIANPWTSSGCSSFVSSTSELNFPLNSNQLDARTTVSVVGPQVWSSISSFPTSGSHSPTTITVNIGPDNIGIQEVALTIYNKANPAQRKTLRSTVQNNVFVWNGIVYNQPLPESPEVSGFYLSPTANVGMNLTVKVADTFTNTTTHTVSKQFTWNRDDWAAGPYAGTGYQLYTPLD